MGPKNYALWYAGHRPRRDERSIPAVTLPYSDEKHRHSQLSLTLHTHSDRQTDSDRETGSAIAGQTKNERVSEL